MNLFTNNTTGHMVKVKQLEATITTSTPACKASWFVFQPTTQQDTEFLEGKDEGQEVQTGEHEFSPLDGGYKLAEIESPEDQSACGGATITIKAKLHS